MNKPYIPLILGTGRQGRESEKVAKYVWEQIQKLPIDTEFVDVRDYVTGVTIPSWEESERMKPWRKIAGRADAFVIVFPEYNHGYPGELKLLLDALGKECNYKPVLLCSVSSGNFGGVRASDHLLPVLRELKLFPLKESVIFPQVKTLFEKSRAELDETYVKKIEETMDILLKQADGLKPLRETMTK